MITDAQRAQHQDWLLQLTQIPTAAGREHRVIRWIQRWCAVRHELLSLSADPSGNLHISLRHASPADAPVYFTAHLDHPAFVVEHVASRTEVTLSFRGGVMADYFHNARIVLWDSAEHEQCVRAQIAGKVEAKLGTPADAFDRYHAVLEKPHDLRPGDVGVWDIGPARVEGELVHTLACDDLAAAAAALAAFDVLAQSSRAEPVPDVRLLFTRAEEIGFVGAIAACRHRTMPAHARVLALENSRSFPESPIGGGPIVRVGDRLSVFSPPLTDAVARRAEQIAGGPASPTASQKNSTLPAWKWQRKLMAGGACEASVFCAAGYESTCVCLPLGNYHNMADLAAVQAGTNTAAPAIGPEYISLSDYRGLVDLLVACGTHLPRGAQGLPAERIDKLWNERSFVLS